MITLLAPSRPRRAAPSIQSSAVYMGQQVTGVQDPGAPTLQQQRQAYRGLVALCVRLRANAVAEAVMRSTVEREVQASEREPVETNHPWVKLLRMPNPSYSRLHIWHWAQQARDLGRGAFFFVERGSRGMPSALHPVFPAFGSVNPIGGPSGEIAGYIFQQQGGRPVRWNAEDVIWLRHAHPISPYESASLLEIAAYESDTDLYQHVYRRDLMKKGGAPRLQITTEQELRDDQVGRMESKVRGKFWGDASYIPVFGKGSHLETVGMTSRDMEALELGRLTRTEIMQIFGVHEGLLSDQANRANADAARAMFADLTVQPEADQFCDQLTQGLLVAFGASRASGLCVVPSSVVPLDQEQAMRQDEAHLRSGQRTVNELRERDGFEPFAGGDTPLVSAALVPLERVSEPVPVPASLQVGAPTDDETDEDSEPERAALHFAGRLRANHVRGDDSDLDAEWQAVEQRRRRAERPVEAAMQAYLLRVGSEVARAVRSRRSASGRSPEVTTSGDVFDIGRWLLELEAELGPVIVQALRMGFETGALRVSAELQFDARLPEVQVALARIMRQTQSIPQALEEEVAHILSQGLSDGLELSEVARQIESAFGDMSDWKARQIAQTSGTAGFNAGQVVGFQEAGISAIRWLSQRDGSTRQSHRDLDGEEIAIGTRFSNGLRYPADPEGPPSEVVNCRCDVLPILTEDGPRSWREDRNERIRTDYPAMRDEHGQTVAIAMLAEREGLSESYVRDLVYKP